MLTTNAFVAGMARLGVVFKPLSPEKLAVYREALGDLQNDAFSHGVMLCIKTLLFFPKPAEIREQARTFRRPIDSRTDVHLLAEVIPLEDRRKAGAKAARELRAAVEALDKNYGTNLAERIP